MARSLLKRLAHREEKSDNLSGQLVTALKPDSAVSEAYRTLRTNFLYALGDASPKAVVVTSPGPKEGKSTTCANLGVVLAQAGVNTLIIDCNFRDPAMHKIFKLSNFLGVVNVLADKHDLSEVWREPLPGLKVAATGSLPPHPTELLSSGRFAELLDQARRNFDCVLVDAPSVEQVSDPVILATQCDGVLLALDAQKTRRRTVRRSIHRLRIVDAHILALVVNDIRPSVQVERF